MALAPRLAHDRFMRWAALVTCTACSFPVTRHVVLDAEHAVVVGARAQVVSINGKPASGTIDLDNGHYMFDDWHERREIGRTDRVELDIEYEDGEVIPGEGVVSTRQRSRYGTASGVTLGIGVPLGILGLVGAAQPPPTCGAQWFCFAPDFRGVYAFVGVLGATMVVTGIGFAIAAALTPARVRRVISMTSGTFTF